MQEKSTEVYEMKCTVKWCDHVKKPESTLKRGNWHYQECEMKLVLELSPKFVSISCCLYQDAFGYKQQKINLKSILTIK